MANKVLILGAGMTGLAAGISSGWPIYESAETPGGICSSYYIHSKSKNRFKHQPDDGEAYRFELGGGHWIFGSNNKMLDFLKQFTSLKHYKRRSAVYFPQANSYVPFPLQYHLGYIDKSLAARAIQEMAEKKSADRTMKEWLNHNFGPTLCRLFFYPFHQLYTAGFYDRIAPQDGYKSPVKMKQVIEGASGETEPAGYNIEFVYPANGLNSLALELADRCNIHYGKRVIKIDTDHKQIFFNDGSDIGYDRVISTLPLNKVTAMAGISTEAAPDPFSSVLVLNIGAGRGNRCPDDHWLYIPHSSSHFHRLGFYSNVDKSFLPVSERDSGSKVSIYVERAYPNNGKPSNDEIDEYKMAVIKELQEWKFISAIDVVDSTWIDVAYTWSWPDSSWKQQAIEQLEEKDITQVGRYARWSFKGIATSMQDGLRVGAMPHV